MPTSGGAAPLLADGSRDLSAGVIVQTQLLGRVLGLRLLRIDGTVLLAPARLGGDGRTSARRTAGAHEVRLAPALAHTVPSDGAPRSLGSGLAEAARLLQENGAALRRRRISR